MNRILSEKIKNINFAMICLVILIHSYNITVKEIFISNDIKFIEEFFSYGLGRVAVPILGLISGFLFFFKEFNYKQKILNRFKTLIIPYILYISMIGLAVLITSFKFNDIIKKIYKYTYHLWYLRDLYIIVIISPIIYYLLKKYGKILIIVALYLIIFQDSIYFSSLLGYFIIGAIGSNLYRYSHVFKEILNSDIVNYKVMLTTFILWLCNIYIYTISQNYLFRNISIIIGIICCLEFIKLTVGKKIIRSISEYSFFIYLFHEPLTAAIKRMVIMNFIKNDTILLVYYFITPIIVVIILFVIAKMVSIIIPNVYKFITGNRGKVEFRNEN